MYFFAMGGWDSGSSMFGVAKNTTSHMRCLIWSHETSISERHAGTLGLISENILGCRSGGGLD